MKTVCSILATSTMLRQIRPTQISLNSQNCRWLTTNLVIINGLNPATTHRTFFCKIWKGQELHQSWFKHGLWNKRPRVCQSLKFLGANLLRQQRQTTWRPPNTILDLLSNESPTTVQLLVEWLKVNKPSKMFFHQLVKPQIDQSLNYSLSRFQP